MVRVLPVQGCVQMAQVFKSLSSVFRVLAWFYVEIRSLCYIGIVKEFIIGISGLFVLIPESIPPSGLDISA